MTIRYINGVLETEKECDPLVLQWIWDVTRTSNNVINVRNYDPDKIHYLSKKLMTHKWNNVDELYDTLTQYIIEMGMFIYQTNGIDKLLKIDSPLLKDNNIIIDAKTTPGYYDSKSGKWIPSYGKVTMELYNRYINQDETVHNLSWPWLKEEGLYDDNNKYILYISELLAILIPKKRLNEVMRNPKYHYKFGKDNRPWKDNPRDNKGDKLIKTTRFDLESEWDLYLLVDVIGALFWLRNNNGIYVPFTPTIRSAELIKQNYLKNLNSTSRTLYRNDI